MGVPPVAGSDQVLQTVIDDLIETNQRNVRIVERLLRERGDMRQEMDRLNARLTELTEPAETFAETEYLGD